MPQPGQIIEPAQQYRPCADTAIVTSYFNPARYESKRQNFLRFIRPITTGACELHVVECAFGELPFELPQVPGLWHVRGRDVMWQKERLLNAVLRRLPPRITKVAWVDADVLFEDPNWILDTSALLEHYPVVQPFEWAIRLPRGQVVYEGQGYQYRSFAAVYNRNPSERLTGNFQDHGHTGFAWAARRELLERHSLFDLCIAGSGDHMISHGFCGDLDSPCIDRIIGTNPPYRRAYARWATSIAKDVRGRISYLPGVLLHLWHGQMADRRYVARNSELASFGFDPDRDVRLDALGHCWEWTDDKPDLRAWAEGYFTTRYEDGVPGEPET